MNSSVSWFGGFCFFFGAALGVLTTSIAPSYGTVGIAGIAFIAASACLIRSAYLDVKKKDEEEDSE
jgi:hypothetical protein